MLWKIVASVALSSVIRAACALPQRDLGGLLPGLEEPEPIPTQTTRHTEPVSALSSVEHAISTLTRPTTSSTQTPTSTVEHAAENPSAYASTASASRGTTLTSAGADTRTNTPATSSSIQEAPKVTGRPPPSSATASPDWRVIGIAVIAVSVIGTTILAVVFFDQWWGFLCDVLGGCKKRRRGSEELVPDWNRGSWDFKVEKLPSYPSFGTPQAQQVPEERSPYTQSQEANHDWGHNPNTSPERLRFPPVPVLRGLEGFPNTQARQHASRPFAQASSDMTVDIVVAEPRTVPRRSSTLRTYALEDAYDGLATE
ncbi:hypothetical protein BC834DRAFT_849611 [Gloeopeniophorella convolvens]|nr:hypothetical protein BC834DRAFT_849611 [Gloeopeniophorella convolvens]